MPAYFQHFECATTWCRGMFGLPEYHKPFHRPKKSSETLCFRAFWWLTLITDNPPDSLPGRGFVKHNDMEHPGLIYLGSRNSNDTNPDGIFGRHRVNRSMGVVPVALFHGANPSSLLGDKVSGYAQSSGTQRDQRDPGPLQECQSQHTDPEGDEY